MSASDNDSRPSLWPQVTPRPKCTRCGYPLLKHTEPSQHGLGACDNYTTAGGAA
jgi:hypothetical protein